MTENELKVMRNAVATIFERVGRHDLCNAAHVFCEGVACSDCPFGCDENLSAIVEDLKAEPPATDEQTPDIPTQVGAIAERCARISETTAHDVFAELAPHLEDWYLCVRVYVGGWCASPDVLKYKHGNFTKDEHLAADANRWLDKVMTEAGAAE